QTLVDNALQGVVILVPFRVLYANKAFARLTGYTLAELATLSPQKVKDLVHPDEQKVAWKGMEMMYRGENIPSHYEFRGVRKNGEIVLLEMFTTRINYKGTHAVFSTVLDITERKQIEKALRENEQFLQNFFNAIQDGVSVLDRELTIVRVNPWMEKMYASSLPLVGKKCYKVYQNRSSICPWCPSIKTINSGEMHSEIVPYPSAENPTGWIDLTSFPLKDKNGKVENVIEYVKDITKQKQAEQKLKESEQKYKNLFESSPFMIILLNTEGKIVDFNNKVLEFSMYKKNELANRDFRELHFLFPDDSLRALMDNFQEILAKESTDPIEIKYSKKDGTFSWLRVHSTLVEHEGVKFIQFMLEDIQKEKKAESMIKEEIKKLKELDVLKSDFITRISHELKTPLTVICGSTELISEYYKDPLDEKGLEMINLLSNGGKRLKHLVDNLLKVTKLDSEELELELSEADFGEIITICINEIKFFAEERELDIQINIPKEVRIQIDKPKITQVIMNLFLNAIKNTPPKGKLTIDLLDFKDYIEFSVKDTGIGITQEEFKKLFKKFGKIERYSKEMEGINIIIEGSGLGLYISKKIIEVHKG
ncbi:MAG: PAS domain S-box protein, partial [Candidatus Hermodarchaeota archaeon]